MKKLLEQDLRALVSAIFGKAGAPDTHARIVADHLVDANLAGHDSHGVMRVAQYWQAIQNGEVFPDATPQTIQRTAGSIAYDGRLCFGQVGGFLAMAEAVAIAKDSGVGAVTLRNCYHSGRLGSYATQATEEGLVGIVVVNAGGGGQSVVPFGGAEPRLATNPLAIGAPSDGDFPFLLDFATSTIPEGKIRNLARQGEPLPEGCVVDHEGAPTTDPNDFYGPPGGAILPMGGSVGYKGFALGFMIDILAGALSGAGCCSAEDLPARDGLLLLALDPEHFGGAANLKKQAEQLSRHVKSSRLAPGFDEVLAPGEIEHRTTLQGRRHGIALDQNTIDDLERISAELGVPWRPDDAPAIAANGSTSTRSSSPRAATT